MLHEAARKENKEKFQRLVSKLGKASVHVKERDYEQTPLHCACDSGNQEVASLLLEKYKVEVNIVDKNGWTPLHSACNSGKLGIIELLLNKGAFPRALTNEGTSPLHYFVRHNYGVDVINAYKIIQSMISKGADVNCQNKHGDSPLHQAAQRGRDQNVLFLLNNKANANLPNKQGETPLHTAIRVGQVGVAKMLVAMGQADINSKIPPAAQSPIELATQIAPDLAKELLNVSREREEKEKEKASSSIPTGKALVRAATMASVTSTMSTPDRLSLRGKDVVERERSTNDVSSDRSGSEKGSRERLDTNLPGPARQSRDLTNVLGPGTTSGLATSVTSSEDLRRRNMVPPSPIADTKSARLSSNVSSGSNSVADAGSDKSDNSNAGASVATATGSPVSSSAASQPVSITSTSTAPSSGGSSIGGYHPGHRKGTSVSSSTSAAISAPLVSSPAIAASASTTASSSPSSSTSTFLAVPGAKEGGSGGSSGNLTTTASRDSINPSPSGNQAPAEDEQQPIACVNCAKDYSSVAEDLLIAQQVHFHTKAPYRWDTLGGPEEQKQRGRLSYDLCVIDNEQFFIKGLLELKILSDAPVNPYSKTPPNMLVFGIWVKVTKDFFNHVVASWNTAYRDKDPKSKSLGELASVLPSYPDTLNLQVLVHTRERGKRFLVEVQPADHPLSFEQDCGVAPHRIKEMIRYLRKPSLLQM